ncbi:MAG: hypothetical protein Q9214_000037 [Letrouitia sp. 1 TL-2023]
MQQQSLDSSDEESEQQTTTNVMLGYASKEPTEDGFSQLGGYPTWLDSKAASATLATCKVCNAYMVLLLQLNTDLPEHFPTHERRLYVFGCKNRACRKKPGTIRGIRGVKLSQPSALSSQPSKNAPPPRDIPPTNPSQNLSDALFTSNPSTHANQNPNPFSSEPLSSNSNPFFSTPTANPTSYSHQPLQSSLASKPPQKLEENAESLRSTFAQKARLSTPPPQSPALERIPWPPRFELPPAYPTYHIDGDYESLDPSPRSTSSKSALSAGIASETRNGKQSEKDDLDGYESTSDTTFLRFASRLAQNPEQVLRYEFRGQPLLYSKSDPVGRLFASSAPSAGGGSRMPTCENCGSKRVFEMQLTPQAITELEAEDLKIGEGMEWGTLIVGVCERDCGEKGVSEGEVGYVEEWVGCQWEEEAGVKKSG